ncbi:capsular biosynthesis protein [Staphylococcus gallinarum]|uniref:capsular biosynthesis protein n=1 Tax=Staphylococcus gallinarum TaxID=1293 RepID=UPI001E3273DA|nr:capsular biosynthesis protein [Staphylococcus gallinarum]MCD8843897.1 capsular biosynthesis protein [Staphylococcus gallinarum]
MNKRIFILDSLKTIGSSLLIAFGLQLIAYPFLINIIGNNAFGKILTIYTLLTIISVVVGNTLNNIRLINVDSYDPNKINFAFMKILLGSTTLVSAMLIPLLIYYFNLEIITIVLILLINFFMTMRVYLIVFYRMKLEYNKIIYVSIFQFIGLLIGMLIFFAFRLWGLLFLSSELLACIYILINLYRRKMFKKLEYINDSKSILKDYIYLLSTNLLNNIALYLDRIILLPIIGGTAVTIAYLATFIGKILATFLYPINNVVLSYISVKKNNNKIRQYLLVVTSGTILSLFVLIICYPVTIVIIERIYMQNSEAIKNYIIIGNLSILIGVICNLIQSLNTKYVDLKIQTIFQTIYSVIFIFIVIILTVMYGIIGFFISSILGNLFKMCLLLAIGYKYANIREIEK